MTRFLGLPATTWSATAAIASALAATVLAYIAWRTKRATDRYVKATEEMVEITHNPVIAVEVLAVEVDTAGEMIIYIALENLGNAPAMMIGFLIEVVVGEETFRPSLAGKSVPFMRHGTRIDKGLAASFMTNVTEKTRGEVRRMNKLVLEQLRQMEGDYRKQAVYYDSILTEYPMLVVTVLYENHLGRDFSSIYMTNLEADVSFYSGDDMGLKAMAGHPNEVFDYLPLNKDEYQEMLVDMYGPIIELQNQ